MAIIGVNLTRIAVQGGRQDAGATGTAPPRDSTITPTKSWLLRHQGEMIPNHSGTRWIAPWFNTAQMVTMIPVLDRSFSYPATVFREIQLTLENLDDHEAFGQSTQGTGRAPEQTFRFDHPEVLTKVELWSGTRC